MKFPIMFLALLSICFSQFKLSGKLTGHDGKPIPNAVIHVKYGTISEDYLLTKPGTDGKYEFSIDKTGFYKVIFAGINHNSTELSLLITKPGTDNVDISLSSYKYNDIIESPRIIGEFNNFNLSAGKQMEKQPDGSFVYETNWDKSEFKYQIVGLEKEGRSINGTMSDDYEYDKDGDWRSIIKVNSGKVKVILDPAKFIKFNSEKKVIFADPNSFSAIINKIMDLEAANNDEAQAVYSKHQESGSDEVFSFRPENFNRELLSIYDNSSDEIKDVIRILYLNISPKTPGYRPGITDNLLQQIPMTSTLWQIKHYYLIPLIHKLPVDQKLIKMEELFNFYTHKTLKADVLVQLYYMHQYLKNEAELERIYKLFENEYAETSVGKFFLQKENKNSKIRVGMEIPDFEVSSLDDQNIKFSKNQMLGKIYLIDFWATWCGPCLGEMDHLHTVYEKYKNKGFEILSFSYDRKADEVTKFRSKKYKMPWMHSFLQGGFEHPVGKAFEVMGIPKPILVDKTGKILALEGELRGENLDKTLAKYFE